MSVFTRYRGHHAGRVWGSASGWAGTARLVNGYRKHPVVDASVTRPVTARRPYDTHRSAR